MADWTERNRDHFKYILSIFNFAELTRLLSNSASTYNSKFANIIHQIIEEIQTRRDWIGVDWVQDSEDNSPTQKTVRLLDYACGTGLVSRALSPYISHAVGIDLSNSMVQEYNTSAANLGMPEYKMHAVVGNLIDASSPPDSAFSAKKFYDFDIVAVGMGWHHFTDPAFAAKELAKRLKTDRVFLIIDFLSHGGFGHGHENNNSHANANPQGHHHNHGSQEGKEVENQESGHEPAEGKADGYVKDKKMEHAAAQTVTHTGFAEKNVKKMFEEAGVGIDFDFVVLEKEIVFEIEGTIKRCMAFMAKGRKV